MITQNQVRDLIGSDVVDSAGEGRKGRSDLPRRPDRQAGVGDSEHRPVRQQRELRAARRGRRAGRQAPCPLQEGPGQGRPERDADDGGHLDQSEERNLYQHYGLDYSEQRSDSGLPDSGADAVDREVTDTARRAGHDTSGPNTDEAMTRSEEQLHAGTETVTAGKARLRKWVETEEQNVSVPVKKEKARLETEPITDANRDSALDGPAITEEEHEVTLTEERPVVAKETVPVERVKLTKDSEQHDEQVSEEVRKERIEAEGDVDLSENERARSSR